MKDTLFFQQGRLLLKILPFFIKEDHFALKGDTAINFFTRDLPRLSIDLDYTFIPITNRDNALTEISAILKRVSQQIVQYFPDTLIQPSFLRGTDLMTRLLVKQGFTTVKVEPNNILRGVIWKPEKKQLCKKAVEEFETSINCQTVSFAELYAGKICAALDRQHPRDLFDIKLLLDNEGITREIHKAFLVYLISHPRPIVELLNPNFQNIEHIYYTEFVDLSLYPVSLDELINTREKLFGKIIQNLTNNDRKFLLSFKNKKPDWNILELDDIEKLPAVQWKLINLEKMDKTKHQKAVEKLAKFLGL